MSDVGAIFDQGLDVFGQVVDRLDAEAWERPSACEGWRAIDVLGHLGTSLDMGIDVMEGRQPSWPDVDQPGDLVDGDPATWWRQRATRCRAALAGADLDLVMDTPMGPRTVADRLAFPAIDLYVHAWDIGHPAGIAVLIPDDLIALAHAHIDPLPDEVVRGATGSFGPEVAPPEDASPTERFLAWTGRPPR